MPTTTRMSRVTGVECGPRGSLVMCGTSRRGEPVSMQIDIADVQRLASSLLACASILARYPWSP